MREINEIVIHHAAVDQQDLRKILTSFDRTHKERLTKIGQPNGGGEYPNIAYHFIITDTEIRAVRSPSVMGYHASNRKVNRESIGICLAGNLDKREPSKYQLERLEEVILELKATFPNIKKVSGHREYAKKSCPGKMFRDELIKHFDRVVKGEEPLDLVFTENVDGHPAWAKEIVAQAKRNGVTTDLLLTAGEIPIYQLLLLIKKTFELK